VALAVASISFRPLPAGAALPEIVSRFGLVFADRGQSAQAGSYFAIYEVQDVQQLNEVTWPPAGAYRFLLKVHASDFREAVTFWDRPANQQAPDRHEAANVADGLMAEFLRGQFALHGNLEVTQVRQLDSPESPTILFELQTRGKDSARGWPHELGLLFGAFVWPEYINPEVAVFWIEDSLVNGVGAWVGILTGIVITAFVIPNMLRKGHLEMLLAKPVRRTTLLLYKYGGGLTFVFLNATVAVSGVWLAVGLRTGIWTIGFPLTVFVMTFFFAILYAVSTLVGVLTRSGTVAIVLTVAAWFLLWMVSAGYASLTQPQDGHLLATRSQLPESIQTAVEAAHFLLPRTKDLDRLTTKLLSQELLTKAAIRHYRLESQASLTWIGSIAGSVVFMAAMLVLSSWRFATRDY
jgi:ABC-type transport system involved in multi-copper enzyme maturation permease subunit